MPAEPVRAGDLADEMRLFRAIRVSFWIIFGFSLPAALLWGIASQFDLGTTEYGFNIYWYLVLHHEPVCWVALLLGLLATYGMFGLRRTTPIGRRAATAFRHRLAVPILALFAFAALAIGNIVVYHRYPFSMDEFAPLFQAKIFLGGAIKATIPEGWRAYGPALTPVFIKYDPSAHTWTSSYLPVHAALQAVFLAVRASDLLNPLLGAVSVLLVADVARRLFPTDTLAPFVSAVLLLTSAQFLLNSISYYSMPAHLCANLLWLSLYLRNTRWSLALAPWIGGLALGLHQLVVHALFVFPFLLRLVLARRIGASAYFASVYLGFIGLWHWWQQLTMFDTPVSRAASLFQAPGLTQFLTQGSNLLLVFSWQSAALGSLLLLGLVYWKRMPTPVRDMLLGLVATFAFYAFFKENQGHGWGYRYIYGVLGNLVIIGTFGWTRISQALGPTHGLRVLAASTAVAVLLQIPLRAVQAEGVIRPFATARDYFATLGDELVVLDYGFVWYGQDLVRNDPFLPKGSPIMLHLQVLPRPAPHPPSRAEDVRWIGPRELEKLGLIVNSQVSRSRAR